MKIFINSIGTRARQDVEKIAQHQESIGNQVDTAYSHVSSDDFSRYAFKEYNGKRLPALLGATRASRDQADLVIQVIGDGFGKGSKEFAERVAYDALRQGKRYEIAYKSGRASEYPEFGDQFVRDHKVAKITGF